MFHQKNSANLFKCGTSEIHSHARCSQSGQDRGGKGNSVAFVAPVAARRPRSPERQMSICGAMAAEGCNNRENSQVAMMFTREFGSFFCCNVQAYGRC